MNNIKFSVLMSVYFKENPAYLAESLESIFNQTLLPNEVVLVEDGPLTAELENTINKYAVKYHYLKIVKLEKNSGLGKALNEGLKHCKYDYVARMDSDDISIFNRFEKQIEYLKLHPNIDVIGSNITEYDVNMKNITGHRIVPENNDKILKTMKKRNGMNHVTVIYNKKKVIESGNYQNMPYFEDYYLWVRMSKNGNKFYNIQESLVNVRCGTDMVKRRGGKTYLKNIINFEKALLELKTINIFQYFFNVFTRSLVSLVPASFRLFIYNNFLRKKVR